MCCSMLDVRWCGACDLLLVSLGWHRLVWMLVFCCLVCCVSVRVGVLSAPTTNYAMGWTGDCWCCANHELLSFVFVGLAAFGFFLAVLLFFLLPKGSL